MWAPPQASTPAYRSRPGGLARPSCRGLACLSGDGGGHATPSPEVSCQRRVQSPNVLSARTRARQHSAPDRVVSTSAGPGRGTGASRKGTSGGRGGRLPEQCAPGGGAEVPAGVWPCPPEGQPPGHGASQGNRGGWSGLSCAEGGSRIAPHCGHHRTAGRCTTGHRTAGHASRKPHPRTPHPQAGRRHPRYL